MAQVEKSRSNIFQRSALSFARRVLPVPKHVAVKPDWRSERDDLVYHGRKQAIRSQTQSRSEKRDRRTSTWFRPTRKNARLVLAARH